MSQLLQAYTYYMDFNRQAYYTLKFDAIPSSLAFRVALKANAENMREVIEVINPSELKLKLIFKTWKTHKDSGDSPEKDFIREYFYENLDSRLLVWVELSENQLDVDFFYDGE